VTRSKTAYEHAFVLLAASSAAVASRPGADALVAEAVDVLHGHFWDEDAGMVVEEWDETWSALDGYRGVNANMHTVEALLAVGDLERAQRIVTRVVHGFARENDWRIPEHFDASWTALPDYNRDDPAHPFRPYGATVGHWFEWSRLTLGLRAALGAAAPDWMLADARALFDAGVREGWAVDGAPGFVYTVDWDGAPVVRQRMHWVAAEAIAAAATLARETGDPAYTARHEQWWEYAATYLIDRERGSWHHELDPANRPDARTWAGKPDVYHAFQAALTPRLPTAPPFARALADGLLEGAPR
jgi:mannose/cellobiose epimerase-like protein (N-acyl-D-glucosamine 2-epimerase family)